MKRSRKKIRNASLLSSVGHLFENLTFVGMPGSLPIKNLKKLNWIISLLIALLFFIFVFAGAHDLHIAFFRFLQSFLFTILLTFGNLTIMSFFTAKDKVKKMRIRKSYYLFSYLFSIIDFLLVKYLYSEFTGLRWEGEEDPYHMAYPLAILATWTMNTFIVVMQDFIILQHNKSQAELENLRLEGNVSEMTNLLLRQQIHPHFLFNALSTIKSLYKKDPPQGENYLVHLVNFLRVSITNHQTKTTLIKNELNFCLDYLKMQKIRFGSAFNYTVELSEQTIAHKYLPYFSLQSLVENALKHNDLSEDSPVQIMILEKKGYIEVKNSVHKPKYKEASTGQGLSNLSERYRLLGEDEIIINSDSTFFCVKIKILEK